MTTVWHKILELDSTLSVAQTQLAELKAMLQSGDDTALVGMEFVTVPAGPFIMGSKDDDPSACDDEKPMRVVNLPDYRIGRYQVTNAQYRRFVLSTPGEDDYPVVNVSWHNAVAYCEWLTGQMRQSGEIDQAHVIRLPTEQEWEKAARGQYGNIWPWGNEFDASRCNSVEGDKGGTTPVGAYSPQGDSPYGAADMAGNVWEWCATKWQNSYKDYRDDSSPEGDALRVLRGGAYCGIVGYVRCAVRDWYDPDLRYYDVGFRVVVASLL